MGFGAVEKIFLVYDGTFVCSTEHQMKSHAEPWWQLYGLKYIRFLWTYPDVHECSGAARIHISSNCLCSTCGYNNCAFDAVTTQEPSSLPITPSIERFPAGHWVRGVFGE
jgi:hypothetical protein